MSKLIIALSVCFLCLSVFPASALNVNDAAPPITLRDANNEMFFLSSYVGPGSKRARKGLVISFFASWCVECRTELPILNSLVAEFEKKGIGIIIIGSREEFSVFEGMLEELKVDKPIILSDMHGVATKNYGVKGLPTTFFIGADGKIRDVIYGVMPDTLKAVRDRAHKLFR